MRLIDADALIARHFSGKFARNIEERMMMLQMRKIICNEPTVDATTVVYCKDCKHRANCNLMADDDFCSDGERKDGEG